MENKIAVKIAERNAQTDDIISLVLVSADGKPLPPFEAGAHIEIEVKPDLVRQYSLANQPPPKGTQASEYIVGILKDPNSRGGSLAIHETFKVGDIINISEPKNLFPLDENMTKSHLYAGGIGITPMLSMAKYLFAIDKDFELHFCARTKDKAAFFDEISQCALTDRTKFHFDDCDEAQKLDFESIKSPNSNEKIYICGPTGFIDFVIENAKKLGWADENIIIERFNADIDASGDSFELIAEQSNLKLIVPADKTIAQVLSEAGVDVPLSCEQGVCGTCLTRIIAGVADHRDLILTDDEREANEEIAICCSRSKTPSLTLDI